MISERILAGGFSPIWQGAFPLLTPNFIQAFNRHHVEPLRKKSGGRARAATRGADVNAPDLAAEMGVQAARISTDGGISIADVFADDALVARAWERSLELYVRYEGVLPSGSRDPAERAEVEEARMLAENIALFIADGEGNVAFGPRIPGFGVVPECEADLAVGRQLVEVKTVRRNFSSRDLKQMLLYFALDWVSGRRRWKSGCLLNPRRAIRADFVVEALVRRISGTSVAEAFRSLLEGISRDVEVDGRF